MSQATTIEELYEFETRIEAALKTAFYDVGITAIVSNDVSEDFQQERPRIDLQYVHGVESGHNRAVPPYFQADSFLGSLNVVVVTNSQAATEENPDGGMSQHSRYRALVRSEFAKMRYNFAVNPDWLPFYSILDIVEPGTAFVLNAQDGYYTSEINFDFKINIKPDAWPPEPPTPDPDDMNFRFSSGAVPPTSAPEYPAIPNEYLDTVSGFTYEWNIFLQQWDPVPKRYEALLTQSGTDAPTLVGGVALENTLGGVPVYAYTGENSYTLTLAGAFPRDKTFPMPQGAAPSSDYGQNSVARTDDDTIQIFFTEDIGNLTQPFVIQILVYP